MDNYQIEFQGYKTADSKTYKNINQIERQKGVVINLDSIGSGTHWTAIKEITPNSKSNAGVYEYYDSFGCRPPYGLVKNSLIKYNTMNDQKFNESNCGQRSIKWLNNKK